MRKTGNHAMYVLAGIAAVLILFCTGRAAMAAEPETDGDDSSSNDTVIQAPDPEPEDGGDSFWMHSGTTNRNVEDPYHATDQRDIAYYTIPLDNEYFPGWTVIEIQSWYKGEVEAFLATDFCTSGRILEVEDTFDGFNQFDADYLFEGGPHSEIRSDYQYPLTVLDPDWYYYQAEFLTTTSFLNFYGSIAATCEHDDSSPAAILSSDTYWNVYVYLFHPDQTGTEESRRFYEAWSRLYFFLVDYYHETGVRLNLSIWDYDEIEDPVIEIPEDDGRPALEDAAEETLKEPDDEAASAAADTGAEDISAAAVNEKKSNAGAAIGISIGAIAVILCCIGIYLFRKKEQ